MRRRDFGSALFAALHITAFALAFISCFGLLLLTFIALLPSLGVIGHFLLGGILLLFLTLLAISIRW